MATPWEWEYIGEAAPWKGKSVKNRHGVHWQINTRHALRTYRETLLPFQGAINVTTVPGALPRAMRSLGFQPADSNSGVSLLISDEPILCVVFTDIYKTCC